MMIPFPYDWMGYWIEKHNIDVSSEAYNELADALMGNYGGDYDDKIDDASEGDE